jgi:hypothetical protein
MKSWPMIVCVLALGACQEASPTSRPSDPPMAKAPQTAGTRMVTAAGVGPITARTGFDRDAIAGLFPGAEVIQQAVIQAASGEEVAVIQVSFDGVPQLSIRQGDKGLQVAVVGPAFATPEGRRVGQTLAEAGFTPADCRPRAETSGVSRTVVCGPEGANPQILFQTPTYNYTAGEVGAEPRPNYDQARLVVMTWRPAP